MRFRLRQLVLSAAIVCCVAAATPGASAGVIFSTLPANGSSGWTATGSNYTHDYDLAARFTVAGPSQRFSAVHLPLYATGGPGGPGVATVTLMSSAGGLPGAVLESVLVEDIATTAWPVRTVNSSLLPVLSTGQTYFIGLSVDGDVPHVAWGQVASSANGYWYRMDGGAWQQDSLNDALAMQVDGINVPEPSAGLALLGCGLGIARRRRWQRHAAATARSPAPR